MPSVIPRDPRTKHRMDPADRNAFAGLEWDGSEWAGSHFDFDFKETL